MVALDGLDISLLHRAFAAGRLPNLQAFAAGATELRVNSDGERLEGTVWPTFTTGTGPGVHGRHWFFQWMAEDSAFAPATDPRLESTPFWKEAVEAGRRVTVFDLPYALPVGLPGERLYTGWGLQDEMDQHAHPAAFRSEIRRRHGRSKVEKDTLLVRTPEDRLRLARRLRTGARQRSRVLLDLVERRDWDVLIFGFGEFHLGGHHLSMAMDLSPKVNNEQAMYSILRPVDDAWPDIVEAAGDDCDIMLFAVHGMQQKVAYPEVAQRIVSDLDGKAPPEAPRDDALRKIRDLLPPRLHQAIWWRLPASFRLQRIRDAWLARFDAEHDHMFVLEGDCGVAIRLNLEGREKRGVLPADEAQAALEELWAEASRYRTEAGEPPFVGMVRTSDVFPGPRTSRLPDAMLLFNPAVIRTRELSRDDGKAMQLTGPESRNGIHTGQGFCFYRPGSDASPKRDTIDNLDFAPTVLERIGVTPPARLQGESFL
jgi:predicted AlkP superfamily phosphohydrolase/phosphomutase